MDGLIKRYVEPYGNALVADRIFAAGDVVIREQPLIATVEIPELLDEIFAAHKELGIRADLLGKDASIDFTLQMLQYCAADMAVKKAVLELFTPDVNVFKEEPYVRAARQYVEQLNATRSSRPEAFFSSVLGPIAGCSGADEVARVVLAWVCNCYSTCDGGGALYKVGSLVNHCCEGNTRYRFVKNAKGSKSGGGCVFVAIRRIDPGEVITTCYLGWDEQTLLSTRMRQKLLVRTKLFRCSCSRCNRRRDPYRSLTCPNCHNPRNNNRCNRREPYSGGDNGGGGGEGGVFTGSTTSKEAADGDVTTATAAAADTSTPDATDADVSGGGRSGGGGGGGFVYWTEAAGDGVTGIDDMHAGVSGAAGDRGDDADDNAVPYWECDSCGRQYGSEEMVGELRRRVVAAGLESQVPTGDPETGLEEEVQRVGEHLDWSELEVSLGAVRQLGARCQAVLGQRHWTTNRCRYTVLELCTAALARTCAASRTAASAYSGFGGGGGQLEGDGWGSVGCKGGGGGSAGMAWWRYATGSGGGAAAAAAAAPAEAPALWTITHQNNPEQEQVQVAASKAVAEEEEKDGDTTPSPPATAAAPPPPSLESPANRKAVQQPAAPASGNHPAATTAAAATATSAGGRVEMEVEAVAEEDLHVNTSAAVQHAAHIQPDYPLPPQPQPQSQLQDCSSADGKPGWGYCLAEEGASTSLQLPPPLPLPPPPPPPLQQQQQQPPLQSVGSPSGCNGSGDGGGGGGGGAAGEGGGEVGGPHVNPHLGRAALLQHTLHHQTLHQQAQMLLQKQQQQQQQHVPPFPDTSAAAMTGPPLEVWPQGPTQGMQHHPRQQLQQCSQPGLADAESQLIMLLEEEEEEEGAKTDCARAAGDTGVYGVPMSVRGAVPLLPLLPHYPLGVSEAGAVRSGGGSTLWAMLEVDELVDCVCQELQALWQWQQHYTPDAPELVLKAVAGPAATALMEVVKDELCSGGRLSSRALTTAETTAARLVAAYKAAPFYDVSGEAYEEAISVVQLAPLIRQALDLDFDTDAEFDAGVDLNLNLDGMLREDSKGE